MSRAGTESSDRDDYPLAFVRMCEMFDLAPRRVRRAIRGSVQSLATVTITASVGVEGIVPAVRVGFVKAEMIFHRFFKRPEMVKSNPLPVSPVILRPDWLGGPYHSDFHRQANAPGAWRDFPSAGINFTDALLPRQEYPTRERGWQWTRRKEKNRG